MLLAVGLLSAILDARASQQGQVVDVAMVDGAATLMTPYYGMVAAGTWRDRRHANVLDGAAHYYGVYETADDKHIAVGAMEPQFYAELCQRLGVDVPQDENEPTAWAAHRAVLAARFREKTRAEWERQLDSPGCCAAPVLSLTEAPQHPHNVAARHLHRDRRRRATCAGAAVLPDAAADTTGPALPGDHTREVLADLGHGRRQRSPGCSTPASRGRVATEHRRKDDRWRGTSRPIPSRPSSWSGSRSSCARSASRST